MAGSVEREYRVIVMVKTNLWISELKEVFDDEISAVLEENGVEFKTSWVEEE
jgi:hypothetical protein